MLTGLRIENFAIVSTLELDFNSGMTAFTGETGAGKSIMIDALMLALGGRADASVIRTDATKCEICACFEIEENSAHALWLAKHDIDFTDNTIILRRVLYIEGRSKSYINGQLFPLQIVKELASMLVDIHGQHQHQTLLLHQTHRQQLDHYANHKTLQDEVAKHYYKYQETQKKLQALRDNDASDEKKSLLEFQISELEEVAPQINEMQSLTNEHRLLHYAQDYLRSCHQVSQMLSDDEENNISSSLNHMLQALSVIPSESSTNIKNAIELINSAIIQCEEAQDELNKFTQSIRLDPERLQLVESRMSTIHQASRKYQRDPDELPNYILELKQKLSQIKEQNQINQALQNDLLKFADNYKNSANDLTASRKKSALKLADEISTLIRQLGMPKGFIEVAITPLDKMHEHGLDKVEYLVCANPGIAPNTLAKVASGGELSRISLAIQMITAQHGATPTLLFDEVDVGIGGATAALVGKMLRDLGERLQLFCVTHQPQVASSAHHHFKVEKSTDNMKTFSSVNLLDNKEKIEEISRMLGGIKITDQTRLHAKEMLEINF